MNALSPVTRPVVRWFGRPLTAEDGQLLGPCCHRGEDGKTAQDVRRITKAKRQEAKHFGLHRSPRPMPGSKASGWKHKIGGGWERRT